MKDNSTPLIHPLILFIVWGFVTVYGALVLTGGEDTNLDELVGTQFGTQLFLAAILVLAYVFFKKELNVTGFKKGSLFKGWIFYYPIGVIFLGFLYLILTGKMNNGSFIFWVILNTFFVGISEELMFRGIILSSLVQRFSFWRSAIIMSLLFGLIHVSNGFITGEFGLAAIQAVIATFSGFLFLAIRIRSNSLITAIVVHWFWDALVILNSESLKMLGDDAKAGAAVIGIILVISPVIFGITGVVQCLKKDVVASFMETQLQKTD